jgi:hypothetical protein
MNLVNGVAKNQTISQARNQFSLKQESNPLGFLATELLYIFSMVHNLL